MLEGIAKLKESGLKVEDVVVFLDHGGRHDPRAKKRLRDHGLRFHSVMNIEQITDVLEEAGRISADQAHELRSPSH